MISTRHGLTAIVIFFLTASFTLSTYLVLPGVVFAQDWGVNDDARTAKKIAAYKKQVNRSAEEGYALKQLLRTVGKGPMYEDLVKEYRGKVEAEPDNYKWHMLLGHMLRHGEDLEGALSEYQAAVAIKESALAYESIAMVHDVNNSSEEAKTAFEKALEFATDREQKERILRALGSMELHRRHFDEAKGYFEQLVELDPKSIFLRKELAQLLIENQRYDDALEQLQAARKLAGRNVQAEMQIMLDIGEVYELQERDDEAIEIYRDAAKKTSGSSWAQVEVEERIIGIYRRQNNLDGLVKYYEESWRSPDFDQLMILSRLYEELGDFTKASEYIDKAVKKSPKNADARLRQIQMLEREGDIEGVIKAYEKLVKALPSKAQYRFDLANLLYRSQRKDEALDVLDAIGKAFSKDADVHLKLADKYISWDAKEKALKEYQFLVKLEPKEPGHLERLGEYYFQTGEREKGLKTWVKVLDIISDKAEGHATLGRIYIDHAMVDEAIEQFTKATEAAPDNLRIKRSFAEVYERARRFNDSVELWEEILKGDDTMLRREARQHIISIYDQQGTLRANLYQYERQFESTPPDIEAGFFLSEAYLKLKELEEAAKVLESILEKQPGDLEAMLALEKTYTSAGQLEKAIDLLQQLAEADSLRARVYYQKIAEHYLTMGDTKSAETWMVETLKVNANDARSHAKLGDVYRKRGDLDKAAESYLEAIDVDPRAYDLYFVLAEIYIQLNKEDLADELYRQIVRQAIDETMIERAAGRAIDYNQYMGTLADLEKDFTPLLHKTPQRPVYGRILIELYEAMTMRLIATTRAGTPEAAEAARAELKQIGKRAIKPLLDALVADDGAMKTVALNMLGELGNPNAAMPLGLLLDDPNRKTQTRAALAIARLNDPRSVATLEQALSTQYDRKVRELAAWGLGRVDAPEARQALIKLADTNFISLRSLAAIGLGRQHSNPEVLSEILSSDTSELVRAAAVWGLAKTQAVDSNLSTLLSILREEKGLVAVQAAWALGVSQDPAAFEALFKLYLVGTPELREAALFGMLRQANPSVNVETNSLWEENAAFLTLENDGAVFQVQGLLEDLYDRETLMLKAQPDLAQVLNGRDEIVKRVLQQLVSEEANSSERNQVVIRLDEAGQFAPWQLEDPAKGEAIRQMMLTVERSIVQAVSEEGATDAAISLCAKLHVEACIEPLLARATAEGKSRQKLAAIEALGSISAKMVGDKAAVRDSLLKLAEAESYAVRGQALLALGAWVMALTLSFWSRL